MRVPDLISLSLSQKDSKCKPGMHPEPDICPEPGMHPEPDICPEPGLRPEPDICPEPGLRPEPPLLLTSGGPPLPREGGVGQGSVPHFSRLEWDRNQG